MTDLEERQPSGKTDEILLVWRLRVLNGVLWTAMLLGGFAAAAGIYSQIGQGNLALAVLYLLVYGSVILATLVTRLGYFLRASTLLGVFLAVPLSSIWSAQAADEASLFLLTTIVLSGVFFGFRASMYVLALAAVAKFWPILVLAKTAFAAPPGGLSVIGVLTDITVFLMLSAITVTSTSYLMRGLERSLQSSNSLLNSLKNQIRVRELAENALRMSERRYRILAEYAADVIWEANAQGIHTYVSPSIESILGWTVQDILDTSLLARVLPTETRSSVQGQFKLLLRGKTDYVMVEEQLRKKDGSLLWCEVRAVAVRDAAGHVECVLGVARDISERKSLEDRLLHSQKMDAVGQLAGGVAHDFNNLLTAINGYSDLLLARMPEDAPWRAELNEIRKAGERAEGLTKHLLAFSRRQILNPEILDLNEVVADLEKMLHRVIGENIVLEVRPAPGLHKVRADSGQIEQVLVNLAVNSRDAMPLGGKLVIACGNVTERGALPMSMQGGTQAAVVLSVTDTGHGLDKEICNRIFEPFFTTKEKGKGTGLGLSTVYGIIRQSGGDATVVSEPGKGATFSIFLP
ncbi:MAG: PAS domain S-box protein, partial [Candidatus Hydrogenedentes bacterium]|nr:PAS domain S-box protein [Candidatus Hydrogenedentota bacterium]